MADEEFNKSVIAHATKHGGKAAGVRAKHATQDADKAVQEFKDALDGKIGHNSDTGGVSGQRLKAFIERIERLEEEKSGLGDDVKDIYAEAKAVGFDTKIMRKVIRLRKMDKEKRIEEEQLLQLYCAAIDLEISG